MKLENTVREKTNRNDHPRITTFNQTYHKQLPANSAYCGTSLEWAIKKAGWGLDIEYAPLARNWARKKKHIVWSRSGGAVPGKKPTRNDVVVFYYQSRWHVGLLEDWQEGSVYCKTVEGNTSDRGVSTIKKPTGKEGVYDEKLRNKKDIYCIVRPYYIPIY
ncbi:hypothetical protein GCM10027347_44630 [Larkinella harenae]